MCGLAAVAWSAEAAPVLGVVGVEAGGDQVASAERVVVGVDAGCAVAEDAGGVACEDCGAEASLVLAAVSALPCGAAYLFGFAAVPFAAACVGECGASGGGADGACSASGHAASPSVPWRAYKRGL